MEDAYITTLDGGRTVEFSPRSVENKVTTFWDDFDANRPVLCVCVETPGGAAEYRPLYQFDRRPPLEQVNLYVPTPKKYRYRLLKRDDAMVIAAIQEQRGVTGSAAPSRG